MGAEDDPKGITFEPHIDWLEDLYTPFDKEQKQPLSLIPYDSTFSAGNYKILEVNLPGVERTAHLTEENNIVLAYRKDNIDLLLPRTYSLQDYYNIKRQREIKNNFREIVINGLQKETDSGGGKLEVLGADIAGQHVSLQVSGNINVSGKLQNQKRDEVRTNYQGKSTTFIIDQKQQLNIEGKIGDRISLRVDQDSEREFDFQNNMRIHYTGKEDEIVQQVDAGNISLTLPGTQFVTFSSKSSGLFGVKAQMKLGGFDVTTIASVEKGQKDKISLDGGSQSSVNEIKDYEYLRNVYFYLDKQYRENMWKGYWGGTKYLWGYNENRVVRDLEVYKSTYDENSETFMGTAYVDPREGHRDEETAQQTLFRRLEKGVDYRYNENLGYIRLSTQLQTSDVLAVAYRTVKKGTDQTTGEYGDWDRSASDTTDVILKLIKSQNMRPSDEIWPLMWKNVYYLGSKNIKKDGTEINIIYTDGQTGHDDRDSETGETFLYKMGVDEKKSGGQIGQDGNFDLDNSNVIKLQNGEIWFPFLHPFEYGKNTDYEKNPRLSEDYNSSIFYNKTLDNNRSDISGASKFIIEFKSESRSSILDLGFMVKEGSESVTLNGRELSKGTDYTIDYFSGTLTLLNEEALNPDANLDVKYEKNQMFELNKKTILGTRIEHRFGDDKNKFIGGTALYYSKSVVDDKVDVGYEPMRNFVWDLNGKYSEQFNFVTRAIDRLPLIETNKPTTVDFEAEIARVHPNPNTIDNPATGDNNGVAFIDDFEGSKRTTPPSIMRSYWSKSSVPVGRSDEMRGDLTFFNPWQRYPTKDIWPNKETSAQAGNNRTDILVLDFDPEWARAVGKNASDATKREAWGGTSYFLRASERDQSRTKFVDVWVKGERGNLHIDLGTISEDQIPNGKLNTEDIPEAGLHYGNGILEKNEDVGLDGVPDEEETVEVTYPDGSTAILGYGDEELKEFKRDPQDPHSDNWYWQNQSDDYSQINGTEGNGTGSPIDAGGKYPDTENMNENKDVDLENNYVTVEIPLDDDNSAYTEGPNEKEWKLYRIPLKDFKPAKDEANFSWENVEAMRLWMDGVTKANEVLIAKIEMVGNEWLEEGIARHQDSSYVNNEETLETYAIKVLNTEENPDYYPPKGVQGEYDKINKIRAKEQSLAFELFQNGPGLKSEEKCMVEKGLLEQMSLINYQKLKYFIHGPAEIRESDSLYHFLKFGRSTSDREHMYEVRKLVSADWQEVKLNLNFLTELKKYYPGNIHEFDEKEMGGSLTIETNQDGEVIRRIFKRKENGKYTGEQIIINGTPAIPRIQTLRMGLINKGNRPFRGEVWVDELRVTDVNKEPGMAMRSKLNVALADVGNINLNYSRQDANFHRVEQKAPSNTNGLNNTNRISIRGNLALHSFTPDKWGLSIPISASYTESNSTPEYYPGTDILSGKSAPDSIKDLSNSYGFNTSFSKRASDYWLTKYTIDQIKLGYNAKWGQNSSVNILSNKTTSHHGSFSYSVPFGRDNSVQPFSWAENIPLIGDNLSDITWYYTPNNLSFNTKATERYSLRIPRGKGDNDTTYSFGLNSNISLGYKMFENLDMSYKRSMQNDLREFRYDKTSIITNLDLGTTNNISEAYNITFNPVIAEWLKPNFTANSNYNWSEPTNSNSVSVDQISNRSSVSTSFALDPANIWKSFLMGSGSEAQSGRSGGRSSRGRNQSRSNRSNSDSDEESKKSGSLTNTIYKGLDILDPVQLRYSINRSISNGYRKGSPGLEYRMGLTTDPGLEIIQEEAGAAIDNLTNSKNLSLSSRLKLFKNISTSLSYTNNLSVNQSQGEKTENTTQSFLPLGNDGSEGFPFPDWSVNWRGIEKLALINKIEFIKSISLSHGFSGKENQTFKDTSLRKASYRFNFQPLIGINLDFKNTLSGNIRINQGKTITNNPTTNGVTMNLTKSINGSMNYTKKGGFKLPLPFFEDKELKNNIKFTMNFSLSENETLQRKGASEDGEGEFTTTSKTSNWNLTPRINYTVSENVTGSIFFKYSVSSSKQRGKNVTRDGGITVNIAIRG
ncbi:MAG: cell surface protein SprA [Candidatus Marinimicrobia bacterium]|nr:cell surface protein SprA [Candidatus Neomarinimicrobiota bacterium]